MPVNRENLIWIDLEMTGLDTDQDFIIEIATIVTDRGLNTIEEGPVMAIYQPDSVLEAMDDWNQNQHGQSGLVDRIKKSSMTVEEAEKKTIKFLAKHVPKGASPMCGNTICQDRRFLARLMPELELFFHYRHIDVSTLKELARRWSPEVAAGFEKGGAHLALDDIRDSIRELQYYRQYLLQ